MKPNDESPAQFTIAGKTVSRADVRSQLAAKLSKYLKSNLESRGQAYHGQKVVIDENGAVNIQARDGTQVPTLLGAELRSALSN